MNRKHFAALVAGLLVSAAFLWLALRDTDLARVGATLRAADPVMAVLLLVMLAGFCVSKAWRWALLLGVPPVGGTRRLTAAVLIGYAGTSLLPMQLGEVVRAWAACRLTRLPGATVVVSIALERTLDLFAVLLVLAIVFLLGGPLPSGLLLTAWILAGAGLVLLAALTVYVACTDRVLAWSERLTRFLPVRVGESITAHLRAGAQGASVLRAPRAWLAVTASSVLQWLFMCGCIAASCRALGIDVPVTAYGAVLGLTIVGMCLPSGPGYVGSIQLAFALALAPFGVESAPAVAASVFYHVLVCGSLIAAGVVCIYRLGGTLLSPPAHPARSL